MLILKSVLILKTMDLESKNNENGNSVAYIYSRKLVEESNKIVQINNRVSKCNI